MPQLVRTTQDAIVNALYFIGELAVRETPDAFMLTTGLDLINELLDKFSVDSIYIPYLTTISFNFVPGKATYSIGDSPGFHDIISNRVVDLVFANYKVPGTGVAGAPPPISFVFDVDLLTNTLVLSSTVAFPTGTAITIATTGVVPQPLFAGETYYSINVGPNNVSLALSQSDALAGIPIVLLTEGSPVNFISTSSIGVPPSPTNIIYPIRIISKAEFYNVVRYEQLLQRPGIVLLDKQANDSFVTFYGTPDQPYPCELRVKSMLNSLGINDDLSGLPPYYYGFLKYALGRKFLGYYPSANWPETAENEYWDYYNNLKDANETDLTIRPSGIIDSKDPYSWWNILAY